MIKTLFRPQRLLILAIALSLVISCLVFTAFAAKSATVCIEWDSQKWTFSTTGCVIWSDVVEANAGFGRYELCQDDYGNVCLYEALADITFPVCYSSWAPVKADDLIADEVYTLGLVALTFDGMDDIYFCNVTGSSWFDLEGSLQLNGFGSIEFGNHTVDGYQMVYLSDEGPVFGIYDQYGNCALENDLITDDRYYLRLDGFSFTVQDTPDGAFPFDTLEPLDGVPSLRLSSLVADHVVFYGTDISEGWFDYYGDDRSVIALYLSDGCGLVKPYILATLDLVLINRPSSTLASEIYSLLDPCTVNVHDYSEPEVIESATCTGNGVSSRECQYCGLIDEYGTPALGHDRNIFGVCKRCDDGNPFSGFGSNDDGSSLDAVGDWFEDTGKNIKDDWNDLFSGSDGGIHTTLDGLKDGISSFLKVIALIAVCFVVFLFSPKILKFLMWVAEGIADTFRELSRLFKSGKRSLKRSMRKG